MKGFKNLDLVTKMARLEKHAEWIATYRVSCYEFRLYLLEKQFIEGIFDVEMKQVFSILEADDIDLLKYLEQIDLGPLQQHRS